MKIIEIDVENISLDENHNLNLVLGFFDGIHLGHQKMINKAISEGETGVMTFDVSPGFALGKGGKFSHITSLYDKSIILKGLGVKYLYVLRATPALLSLDKDEFINKILKKINPKKIFVGEDYRFGKDALGDINTLKEYFDVDVTTLLKRDGQKISSRYIRELISSGEMKKVNEYLSRPYQISGLVIEGKHNGEKIGFPTANLELSYPYVLPKIGVYIGYVKYLSSKYKAIISVSTHPTIQELKEPIIEVHLLSYKGNLYGKEIDVQFVDYIRDVYKFASLDGLKDQLEKDLETAKNNLK